MVAAWRDREQREDRRFAMLATVIANGLLKKEDGSRWEPADFCSTIPRTAPRRMSDAEMVAAIERWHAMSNK